MDSLSLQGSTTDKGRLALATLSRVLSCSFAHLLNLYYQSFLLSLRRDTIRSAFFSEYVCGIPPLVVKTYSGLPAH